MKTAVLNQTEIGRSSELRVGAEENLRRFDAGTVTEEFERVEQIGEAMSKSRISGIEVFIENLTQLAADESESELVAITTALLTEVAFGGQLEMFAADGNRALVEIDGKQPLAISELKPALAVARARVRAKQVEMKFAPLVEVRWFKSMKEAIDLGLIGEAREAE